MRIRKKNSDAHIFFSVWKLNNKPLSMKKLSVLNGHSDAITCLVSCQSHAVLVSASRDLTVLVWHLSEMFLIRQLPKHPHAVLAVAVNDATGDIATACATLLHVWTINGALLAVLNTCDVAPAIDPQQMIISLAFSTVSSIIIFFFFFTKKMISKHWLILKNKLEKLQNAW